MMNTTSAVTRLRRSKRAPWCPNMLQTMKRMTHSAMTNVSPPSLPYPTSAPTLALLTLSLPPPSLPFPSPPLSLFYMFIC